MQDIILIEDSFFVRLFCVVGAISLAGWFILHVILAVIDKLGYKGINIFYRRKADEQDIKIESVDRKMNANARHYRAIDTLLIEIQKYQRKINKQFSDAASSQQDLINRIQKLGHEQELRKNSQQEENNGKS